MKLTFRRCGVALLLAAVSTLSHALVFAVNEGVTYRVPNEEIRAKYAGIAADLAKLLRQPVTIEPIAGYPALRQGLADKAYDLAMVHPAHLSIAAMKNSGYRLVAVTKGFQDYRANFLVKADSPLKSLGDAAKVGYVYTRYQEAVPFFVENNLTPSGVTAANAVVKEWLAHGGKVMARSRPVPIKHIIASPSMSNEEVALVRDYLLALDSTEDGRKKLAATKWQGFAAYDQSELMAIGTWLGL